MSGTANGDGLWWTGPDGDLIGATVFRKRAGHDLWPGAPVRLCPFTLLVVYCPPTNVRELIGVATRAVKQGEVIEYSPDGNTPDVLTRIPFPGVPGVPRYQTADGGHPVDGSG